MSARWHFLGALVRTLLAAGGVGLIGNDYYLRILFMMTVYYLCGAGMNILVGFAGQKSLGQAGLFAAGAYGVALLTTLTSINPWTALLLSMLPCSGPSDLPTDPGAGAERATSAGVSEDARGKMAAVVNLAGHLCASVERVSALRVKGAYEVECILLRGGAARATYAVDLNTGRAERL